METKIVLGLILSCHVLSFYEPELPSSNSIKRRLMKIKKKRLLLLLYSFTSELFSPLIKWIHDIFYSFSLIYFDFYHNNLFFLFGKLQSLVLVYNRNQTCQHKSWRVFRRILFPSKTLNRFISTLNQSVHVLFQFSSSLKSYKHSVTNFSSFKIRLVTFHFI